MIPLPAQDEVNASPSATFDPVLGNQLDEERGHTHWVSRAAFPLVMAVQLIGEVALGFAVYHGWYWLAVPLVLLVSHTMHGGLIGFHEASHGQLRKSRFLNDLDGLLMGTLSFMSFTGYRAAHQTHHMHLATVRDEEMWPFVNVDSPRWARRLAAFIELNLGLFFTPFLFARMFLRKNSFIRSRKVRRKIWGEYLLMLVFWTVALSAVAWFHVWNYFAWMYLAPGLIAGNMQSWRKYIEHIGLSGHTAKSATRTIISDSWAGRFLSLTLLHEPFHAVHHLRAGLPHYELPLHAASLVPNVEGEVAPFPNYWSAIKHLISNLSDPRVGSHWPDSVPNRSQTHGSSSQASRS